MYNQLTNCRRVTSSMENVAQIIVALACIFFSYKALVYLCTVLLSLCQIEDLRLSMSRMEKEQGRREDFLRQEISDLQQVRKLANNLNKINSAERAQVLIHPLRTTISGPCS